MTAPELPELPTTGIAVTDAEGRAATIKALTFDNGSFAVFDADQMHAFYRQGFAAGMEAAAVIAESDEFYGNATQHAIAHAIRAACAPK
jgi:hypothetical protein